MKEFPGLFVLVFLLIVLPFAGKAQSPEIVISDDEYYICQGDTVKVVVSINNLVGDNFFINILKPDQTSEKLVATNDFILRLTQRGTYYITSFGIFNDDPLDDIPCNEPITVIYSPDLAFTGGGIFCDTDNAEAITAHFTFDSSYVFNYLLNGLEMKIESINEEYQFPLENLVLESIDISENGCTVDLSDVTFLYIIDQLKPVISGDGRLCMMEWGVFEADTLLAPLVWDLSGSGISYLDIVPGEPLQISARWEEQGIKGISASYYVDSLQCYSAWSDILDVSVISSPEVLNIDTSLCPGSESIIVDIGYHEGEIIEWLAPGISGTTPEFTSPGEYDYVKYDGMCSDTGNIYIRNVCGDIDFFVPEAFTPNGDQINDFLEIFGHTEGIEFSVYAPSGILVYTSKENSQPWDGTYKEKPAPNGTYYWTAVFTDSGTGSKPLSGIVTIIR